MQFQIDRAVLKNSLSLLRKCAGGRTASEPYRHVLAGPVRQWSSIRYHHQSYVLWYLLAGII